MALIISIISLIISSLTFWLTKIKKGKLKMTRPSIICLLGQNGRDEGKVFIRTLLYSDSEQGQYVQNMFIRISKHGESQDFDTWAYGDKELMRGSGLFVSKVGISLNHHFLLPKINNWKFSRGEYYIEVFAEIVGKSPKVIFEHTLFLAGDHAESLYQGNSIYYEWQHNYGKYINRIETMV
ncbi:MAG TPA: hypothetical protein VL088_07365 [Pedobacter sp.]|nr:hypothetical protein [Pedobacter sp.]